MSSLRCYRLFCKQRFRFEGAEEEQLRGCARRVRAAIMDAGGEFGAAAGRGIEWEDRRAPKGPVEAAQQHLGAATDMEESTDAENPRLGSGRDSGTEVERPLIENHHGEDEEEDEDEAEEVMNLMLPCVFSHCPVLGVANRDLGI